MWWKFSHVFWLHEFILISSAINMIINTEFRASCRFLWGAQLIKLNNEKVAGLPFKEILQKIETAATPITAHFLENPALEEAWTKAETLKEEANKLNKDKSDPNRCTIDKQYEECLRPESVGPLFASDQPSPHTERVLWQPCADVFWKKRIRLSPCWLRTLS